MAHQLNIKIEDSLTDLIFLSVTDISVYDSKLTVTNPVLLVRLPGSESYCTVNFIRNSTTNYTTKSLNYSRALSNLPDGLYEFVYSVCPNEKVSISVSHFRVSNLEWDIKSLMAETSIALYDEFDIDDCNNIKLTKQQNRLIALLYQLEAIKGSFINNNYQKSINAYNYIKKQVEKYSKSQSNCKNC